MDRTELRVLSELICGNADHGHGAALVKEKGGTFKSFAVPSPYRSEYDIKKFLADKGLMLGEEVDKAYAAHKSSTPARDQITLRLLEQICAPADGTLNENARKLVLALADPRSYTSPELASDGIRYLNEKLLSVYEIRVQLKNGVRPIFAPLVYDIKAVESLNYDIPNFESVLYETALIQLLVDRWEEIIICSEGGAFLSATILLGSVFEALLRDRILSDVSKAKRSIRLKGSIAHPDAWTLEQLIQCCVDVGWISREREAFLDTARQMRNLVHPHAFSSRRIPSLPTKALYGLV